MRQFLTAEDANSLRVLTGEIVNLGTTPLSSSRARSSSLVNASESSNHRDSPPPGTPATPIKGEPSEHILPHQHSHRTMDSMEMIMERKSRQSKRDKKERRDRSGMPPVPIPPSPSSSNAGYNLDMFMHSRPGRRVDALEEPEAVAPKQEEVSGTRFLFVGCH